MDDHPRRPFDPSAFPTLDGAVLRAWLARTWVGRLLVAGLGTKLVVSLAGLVSAGRTAPFGALDRAANLALAAAGLCLLFQLIGAIRRRLLWSVRNRLVLSYVLIGVVPILLLGTFAAVGIVLLFFNISSYLVQNRLDGLTREASVLARRVLVEVEQAPQAGWDRALNRRAAAAASRYPGAAYAIVPTSGRPPCGVTGSAPDVPPPAVSAVGPRYAGSWARVDPPEVLPRWVSCTGFVGVVAYRTPGTAGDGGRLYLLARAVALPEEVEPSLAVIVDLPVAASLAASLDQDAGIDLGTLSLMSDASEAMPIRGRADPSGSGPPPSPPADEGALNTAAFVSYTDWERGAPGSLAMRMSVRIPALYAWLSQAQGRIGTLSFGRVLVYVLVALGGLLLIVEIGALAMGLTLARSITGSVHALFAGTRRVRQGDLAHRIGVRAHDQLGDLAGSFNEMTASLSDLLAQMAEKKRLEEELRIARQIQMSLLPHGPLVMPGLSVTALCLPAREVGGDYYDFLPLGPDRVGVIIADVSGKGTSAAFYMAELKGLMLALSEIHGSPRQLLIDADRLIADHLDSRSFITMIYAVIDTRARTMTCARAGHTPFVYVPAAGGGAPQAQVLTPDGMVLGLKLDGGERFRGVLEEVTMPLEAGDLFVFYTDGISEAMNEADDCFGDERLSSLVQAHAGLPSDQLRDLILRDVERFVNGAPQHDDMTLIVMKVEEAPGPAPAGSRAVAAGPP